MKNKIIRVWTEHKQDDSPPDFSYLGKYSDDIQPYAIIRVGEHAGKFASDLPEDYEIPSRGREFRFFIPPHENYKDCTNEEIRKYCKQDFERMEALNRGNWYFIGVIAKAEIQTAGTTQILRSGGLWGVESDAGEHIKEIEEEQLNELRPILLSLGFGKRAIEYAINAGERKK